MDKQPLVSVIVVCYNAAEYIEETLESVKAQTYKNIELIVSDDCSKDGTPDIAKKWLDKNSDVFVRTELVTIDHNTGVSANYNRAVKVCSGEWIKNIDGDDLIDSECIENNINYIKQHRDCEWVFSQVQSFSMNGKVLIKGDYIIDDKKKSFFILNAFDQFKRLLFDNLLPSQSNFIKAQLLKERPYNEDYRGLEDAPMWLWLAKDGIKAHYFDTCTALYRINDSITSSSERFYSPIYFESRQKYFWQELVNYIKQYDLQDAYNNNRRFLLTMEFADVVLGNKRSRIRDFIYKVARSFIYKKITFKL